MHKKTLNLLSIIAGMILLLAGCNANNQPEKKNETGSINNSLPVAEKKTIVFFGNSLTAGYGLSPSQAFPAIIQRRIDSLKLPYQVVNAGVSGETSSGGNTRVDWILRQPVDIFILELGANDGLRGLDLSQTQKSLQSIIDKVKTRFPSAKILLAGMQVPPNMGQQYATAFRNIYTDLSTKNGIPLVPFLLEGVGGETRLNQDDGIHPTAEGHVIVAENLWRQLAPLL